MQPLQNLSFTDLANWQYLLPELTLAAAFLLLIVVDLLLPSPRGRSVIGALSIGALALAAFFTAQQLGSDQAAAFIHNAYRIDDYANLFKLIFLGSAALLIFMSLGSLKKEEVPNQGELYYLYLPAVLGAMVLASSGELITLFVGLELLSISSFILVGMRKNDSHSTEGAFKYVVLGGISSAFVLYGMSFLYGITGTTDIALMRESLLSSGGSFTALIYVSFFLMLTGIGFKIAAAPFHSWAADVYQAAPVPVAGFLSVVSKGAGFALLFRLVYNIFYGLGDEAVPIHNDIFLAVSVLSAAAMIVGNTMALRQRNVKRMLAFSGIANSGYLLVPLSLQFTAVHFDIFSEMIYYLIAYAFMNIGAFAVFLAVSRSAGHEEVSGFAGLYYRSPSTAVAAVLLVLSLAGIPLTGGFIGKLYILLGTMESQVYWLGTVMLVTSVISYYYYFSVVRQMFMRQGIESSLTMALPLRITIWLCAAASVALGILPGPVTRAIHSVFSLSYDLLYQAVS
ncbi:NADH-quinone oxidoreductase subunit N [Paenibacillus gansuensis]|uniref:NADH-quinone oxidoreductase subunit N n=1 Tax=Paenibacillus gansuensis TaxID=306542 RepID=A0ABW5PKF3_9BACL